MARRFQFSIRFLLVATTVIASAIATARLESSQGSVLLAGALTICFATAAIVGSVRQTDKLQSFWIGVAVILAPAAALSSYVISSNLSYMVSGNGGWVTPPAPWPIWCVAPFNGLVAVLFHWLLSPKLSDER